MTSRCVAPGALNLSLGRLRHVRERAVVAMMSSLRSKGQLSPLVAARHGDELVLVDGFTRQVAATRLGWMSVLVEEEELSPTQMKAQLYVRNRERGTELVDECRLVHELTETDGLTQVQIGDLLDRHKSWVCRRLLLHRSVSLGLMKDTTLGLLSPGVLRRLAQLPPRNQEEVVAVARREGLSPRETTALVDLWHRTTDPEVRRYLRDHPRDAVRRAQSGRNEVDDPRLTGDARALLDAVCSVVVACIVVERRLQGRQLEEATPEVVNLLAAEHHKAEAKCEATLGAVDGWVRSHGGGR